MLSDAGVRAEGSEEIFVDGSSGSGGGKRGNGGGWGREEVLDFRSVVGGIGDVGGAVAIGRIE